MPSLYLLLIIFLLYLRGIASDAYFNNGGNIVGITGKNFVLIASDNYFKISPSASSVTPVSPSKDSSLVSSYLSVNENKLIPRVSRIFTFSFPRLSRCRTRLHDNSLLLSSYGNLSDFHELKKKILLLLSKFNMENDNQSIQLSGFVNVLSLMLYSRRAFPFYCFCLIGGINEDGQGELYRYDPLGSFEKVNKACLGESEEIFQPFLDSLDQETSETVKMLWKNNLLHDSFEDPLRPLQIHSYPESTSTPTSPSPRFLTPAKALNFTQTIFKIAARKNKNFGNFLEAYLIVSDASVCNDPLMEKGEQLGKEDSSEITGHKRHMNTITRRYILPIT